MPVRLHPNYLIDVNQTPCDRRRGLRKCRLTYRPGQPLFYNLVNLIKPAGYVMHQQFNIQQLYALPTLYLCVLYLSENKQRLVPLTA